MKRSPRLLAAASAAILATGAAVQASRGPALAPAPVPPQATFGGLPAPPRIPTRTRLALVEPPPITVPVATPSVSTLSSAARSAALSLVALGGPQSPYPPSGLWEAGLNPSWWQSALVLSTLTAYQQLSGDPDPAFQQATDRIYAANVHRPGTAIPLNFADRFNDDTAWWGLAWLAAARYQSSVRHDLTLAHRYLAVAEWDAQHIFTAPRMCGGIRWRDDQPPDTITVAEFIALAAELAQTRAAAGPLGSPALARRWLSEDQGSLRWLSQSGLIDPGRGTVKDSLNAHCRAYGGPVTYTEGEVADALTESVVAAGGGSQLLEAARFLNTQLHPGAVTMAGGILQQPCEGHRGLCAHVHDPFNLPAYKGILVSAVTDWTRATGAQTYAPFLRAQAAALLRNSPEHIGGCRPGVCTLGFYWGRRVPPAVAPLAPDASTQASGLAVLLGALSVSATPPPAP